MQNKIIKKIRLKKNQFHFEEIKLFQDLKKSIKYLKLLKWILPN